MVGDRWANVCLSCKRITAQQKLELPPRYQSCSWENFRRHPGNQEAVDRGVEWVDSGGAQNLFFYGPPGTGKTYLAATVVRELARPNRFWRVPEMLLDFQASVKEHDEKELIARYEDAGREGGRILVFDDVGAHRVSDFGIEMFGILLTHFHDDCRMGLIFTSNLTPKGILDTRGERVASRLKGIAQAVKLEGKDQRFERPAL